MGEDIHNDGQSSGALPSNRKQDGHSEKPATQPAAQRDGNNKAADADKGKKFPLSPRLLIIIAVVLLAVGSIGYFFYQRHETEEDLRQLVLQGNVDIREVELGFRVAGRIAEMRFDEGSDIKAGVVLAVLDKAPFNADLAMAKAQVAQAQATLTNAQALLERQEGLVKSGSVSKQDYDNALAQQREAQAALEAAQARQLTSEVNLTDTEIFAPADGTIFARIREPGAIVASGLSVYTLSLHNPVWIRAYVDEPDLGRLKPDMKVDVTTDTDPDSPFQGTIGFISPDAEFTPKNVETRALRTDLVYRIRVLVNDPEGKLRQGMPVTVTIPTPDYRGHPLSSGVTHNEKKL